MWAFEKGFRTHTLSSLRGSHVRIGVHAFMKLHCGGPQCKRLLASCIPPLHFPKKEASKLLRSILDTDTVLLHALPPSFDTQMAFARMAAKRLFIIEEKHSYGDRATLRDLRLAKVGTHAYASIVISEREIKH